MSEEEQTAFEKYMIDAGWGDEYKLIALSAWNGALDAVKQESDGAYTYHGDIDELYA